MKNNKTPQLTARARRFALIMRLLFAKNELNGKVKSITRGARHLSYGVRLSDSTQLDNALKLAESLALSCGVNAVLAQRVEGLVSYQIELPQAFWEYYTRADVEGLQVGLAEQRQPIEFELDPPHSLIAGTSGSGKSVTLQSILVALVTTHAPNDLGLVVIDPHNDYADFQNEHHLIMPVATESRDICQSLLWVNRELSHRKQNNIRDGQVIVVAIDEADTALADGRNLEIAKNISKQARKYRIHLLLATQRPLHSDLPGILDNLLNKWVGQLVDASTSARVTGHAGLMAHKLTPKGDFLHVNGPEAKRLQIAMPTQADFDSLTRGEIQPIQVESTDVVELPPELPQKPPGRPKLELDPELVGWYLFHYPEPVSRNVAKELLGISRDNHNLHNDFTNKVIESYLKLQSQKLVIGA